MHVGMASGCSLGLGVRKNSIASQTAADMMGFHAGIVTAGPVLALRQTCTAEWYMLILLTYLKQTCNMMRQ